MAAAEAAGQAVPEGLYKQALALAYEARSPQSLELSREPVEAYPTAENWRQALMIFRDLRNPTCEANLELTRLMREPKSLTGERVYYVLAEEAKQRRHPGQAKGGPDTG